MNQTNLSDSIAQLTTLTVDIPDQVLERSWVWGEYDSEGVRFSFFRTYEELQELSVKLESIRNESGLPLTPAQKILGFYHAAYTDLQAATLGLNSSDEDREIIPGEWSIRRVLSHIIGADLNFFVSVKFALERHRQGLDHPNEIPDEDWDRIGEHTDDSYNDLKASSFDNLSQYHSALHTRILSEFGDISDEELKLPSTFWETKILSVRFRLHRFESHMRQHTIQIDKIMAALGHPKNEAKRLLRMVYRGLASAEAVSIGTEIVGQGLLLRTADSLAARNLEIEKIIQ